MGASKPTIIENGLQFNVSGLTFKGIVQITLNGKDLYDIKLVKAKRQQNQELKALGINKYTTELVVQEEINDVFVEDMMGVLEMKVENRQKRA